MSIVVAHRPTAHRSDIEAVARRLHSHVERLATTIGESNLFRPDSLSAARDYIAAEWRRQGYAVTLRPCGVDGSSCANVETQRDGSPNDDHIVLLGAHYDSVRGSPGANDNASGVAALLEISRLFVSERPSLTVRFVAFVNEEPPFFLSRQQGSWIYAKEARARGDDIRLMISLETIGFYRQTRGSQSYPPFFRLFYPDRGNFLAFVSDLRSRSAMRKLAALFRKSSSFPLEHVAMFRWIPGVAWSDHVSFWRMGYPAVMVTDTAFYRYPFYHSPADTAEKLAYPELAEVTLGLFGAVRMIGESGFSR